MNKWVKLGDAVFRVQFDSGSIVFNEDDDITTVYTSFFNPENDSNYTFEYEGNHVEEFYNILKGVNNV